jgi:hypothetical protein
VRDAIHDFNERGLAALEAGSSRPKRTRDAFDEESAEALREMLHRSPREFGHDTSLWTLVRWPPKSLSRRDSHKGGSPGRPSGRLWRVCLEFVGSERNDGSPPPILCTKEKKKARPTDESS